MLVHCPAGNLECTPAARNSKSLLFAGLGCGATNPPASLGPRQSTHGNDVADWLVVGHAAPSVGAHAAARAADAFLAARRCSVAALVVGRRAYYAVA